jgi:hypothetical protein
MQFVIVALVTAALSIGSVWVLAAQEVGPFKRPVMPPTMQEQLSDGKFDSNLILAEMAGSDFSVIGEYVRAVSVYAVRNYSEQEVLDVYNANVQQMLDRIKGLYGEDVPEAVQLPELADTVEDLPQLIKDRFDDNGILSMPLVDSLTNGFLLNGKVAIPSRAFEAIFRQPADSGKKIMVNVRLLANADIEDRWKEEELFNGTALEFVKALDTHTEIGLAFMARPDNNILARSDGVPYEATASLEEIGTTNLVVYGGSLMTLTASVSLVLPDRDLFVITGVFDGGEVGVPVFVLRDGEVVWAGVITSLADSHRAIVASAETVSTRSKGGE